MGNDDSDKLYFSITGLDKVHFETNDIVTCLTSVQVGVYKLERQEDADSNHAFCAAYDKDLGW